MKTTTKTKTTIQCPELDTLIREGESLLDGEIHVTFTEEDQRRAGDYLDNRGCLLCCALTRMGYRDIGVGGWDVCIAGDWWDFGRPLVTPNHPSHFYHKGQSLVGKTLVLKKRE